MRKLLFLCAIMALAALSAAGMASASSNLANGTTVTSTNTAPISLSGGLITCTHSAVSTTITNNAAGLGVTGDIENATWTGCGAGNAVHATNVTSWKLTTNAGGGPTVWPGKVDNVVVDLTLGSSTCKYSGTLSGGNYDNGTERLTLGGNLSFVSGTGICVLVQNPSVSGTYNVSPTLQLS